MSGRRPDCYFLAIKNALAKAERLQAVWDAVDAGERISVSVGGRYAELDFSRHGDLKKKIKTAVWFQRSLAYNEVFRIASNYPTWGDNDRG